MSQTPPIEQAPPEGRGPALAALGGPGVAVAVLVGIALLEPSVAPILLVGAVVVAVATWWFTRRPAREQAPPEAPPLLEVPVEDAGSAALLGRLLDALNDPILLIAGGQMEDIAGRRVILSNRAAKEVLRIQGDGAPLVSSLRSPEILEAVDEALFGGVSRVTDYEAGGAQPRYWRAWTRPMPSGNAESMALLALRDETDSRRMETMRVDFLANASHELRTPLASLSGFIETLKGHARDDTLAREKFLDIMAVQADRMSRLVADLLSLSRIELNEHIPPSGRVDLAMVIADVVDAMTLLAQERGVSLTVAKEPGPVIVTGERDELIQVVQNLIDNAVKYSTPGGVVEVAMTTGLTAEDATTSRMDGSFRLSLLTPDREAQARYAVVSVRDHGPGMAREHLPRLTERFYRVEGQKSGERSGTGLGLAIVKHIANRHRGGLVVESVVGEGAVFTAYFPMEQRLSRR